MGHHIVPKLHLREFANDEERVALVSRDSSSRVAEPGLDNVLSRNGFYTTDDEDGAASNYVEEVLSRIEAQAAMSLRRLRQGRFPPRPVHRFNIAAFLALQFVRGPEMRAAWDAVATEMWRQLNVGMPRDEIARRFEESEGRPPTAGELDDLEAIYASPASFSVAIHRNQHAFMMFDSAWSLIAPLLRRNWQLIEFRRPSLLTSDRPVTIWADSRRAALSPEFGLLNADEVRFPVDRRTALVMWLIRAPSGEIVRAGTEDDAREMNESVAASGREWIVHHLEDDPLSGLVIPDPEPLTSRLGPPPGAVWASSEPFDAGLTIGQSGRQGRPLTV